MRICTICATFAVLRYVLWSYVVCLLAIYTNA